jgi:putative endonuclease
MDDKVLGRRGEAFAAEYLEGLGFRVAERNFTCRVGEIDLIVVRDRLLVFVEVKTRRSLAFGSPQEAVVAKKIRHIRRVAQFYLVQFLRIHRLYADFDMRFDVVEVRLAGAGFEINHIENAF